MWTNAPLECGQFFQLNSSLLLRMHGTYFLHSSSAMVFLILFETFLSLHHAFSYCWCTTQIMHLIVVLCVRINIWYYAVINTQLVSCTRHPKWSVTVISKPEVEVERAIAVTVQDRHLPNRKIAMDLIAKKKCTEKICTSTETTFTTYKSHQIQFTRKQHKTERKQN